MTTLDTSRKIYEATGWDDATVLLERFNYDVCSCGQVKSIPKYSADYLLGKLPDAIHSMEYDVTYRLTIKKIDNKYFVEYSNHGWFRDMKSVFTKKGFDTNDESLAYWVKPICADTPAEALGLLVIKLKQEGVI